MSTGGWGTPVSSNAITGHPLIAFEYSDEARRRGLELSVYTLALSGPKLRKNLPAHQMGLPGPVYDTLPDGWGMLLVWTVCSSAAASILRVSVLWNG